MNSYDIHVLNQRYNMNLNPNATVLAMDDINGGVAQTIANSGVPAFLSTFIVPGFIETLTAPMVLGETFGERQMGSSADLQITVAISELYGQTSSYGDYNDNGMSENNVNWEYRQPYRYQTNITIGELEQERAAQARIPLAEQKIKAATLTLNQTQNYIYTYGVAGLRNYGLLNDPSLLPDSVGANWYNLTAEQLYNEVLRLYTQLVEQSNGVFADQNAKMTLIMSPVMKAKLHAVNQFGLNAWKTIKENFPNLEVIGVPQYSTDAGEKIQLVVNSFMGQDTLDLAFVEKLRVHAVDVRTSSWYQKRSQSTLGAIIYRPFLIANQLATNTP